MAEALTDEVLQHARRGEPDALATVYRSLAGQVLGYLEAKGVDDAEGATQDVFLTVFSRIGDMEGGVSGLRSFTFSVAHARMVDATRARARAPWVDEYSPEEDPRRSPSPQDEVMDRLGSGELAAVLDGLLPDQRECVLLRIVAGLSIEETAAALGKSAGAVKQLQRRGLLAMKKALEGAEVHV
ncbi:sigma-70 family RNA polymerase sigma factor [Arthrobacter ginkgonis]|uniref:Sigma-70 family RNA polymerase sigma factor n=1 Tax=Arthrobacter ginkgonis TaxID=1630594 RepID=A0ABP7BU73_9MICC